MRRVFEILLSLGMGGAFLFSSQPPAVLASETTCREFIETRSAKQLSKELGKPEKWVAGNYRIKLFEKEPVKGKGRIVGKLLPGSRAEILKVGADNYQVKSPLDGTVGWISRAQVRHILLLDSKTLKPCR